MEFLKEYIDPLIEENKHLLEFPAEGIDLYSLSISLSLYLSLSLTHSITLSLFLSISVSASLFSIKV